MARPVLTLLTDFGLRDPYVGIVKGVILGICPEAQLVDLTHEVPPEDVAAGAFLLEHAAGYFPPGTVHLGVVDPGVGSARRMVAVRAGGQIFVAPDNGLLSRVLRGRRVEAAVVLEEPRYFLPEVSSTFHGRDVLAPVAAHLAAGVSLDALGPPAGKLERLGERAPAWRGDRLRGRVVFVDRFGNLVTDIDPAELPKRFRLHAADFTAEKLHRTYADGRPGEPIALVSSFGLVELAVREGSAAKVLGLDRGAPIVVERR